MTRLRVVVVVVALGLVVGGRLWIARPSAESGLAPGAWRVTAIYDPAVDVPRDDDAVPPKLDVLGNEVDDAIGDYRVDVRGEIYERHSPETEVSRLTPPVS